MKRFWRIWGEGKNFGRTWLLIGMWLYLSSPGLVAQEKENWVYNGNFEFSETIVNPWTGVDSAGVLRKAVASPGTNPFVTKSNQFSYNWLGTSASFVDMDGDGLSDLVSPDGAGIFWCWKNTGKVGAPEFVKGEVMPLLVDNLKSRFARYPSETKEVKKLDPAVEAARKRVDEKREKEMERLVKVNERRAEKSRVDKEELQRMVEEKFPYEEVAEAVSDPNAPGPEQVCVLNAFRRLRAVASPGDWNGDGLVDFVVGDSDGVLYLGRNQGSKERPQFGVATSREHRIPLKLIPVKQQGSRTPVWKPVEFVNYATPFVCDWDQNGVVDVLVGEGTYSVNSIRWFRDASRTPVGTSPVEVPLYVGEERTFLAPFAYDWDADGLLDLFVCDDEGKVSVHRNPGGGAPLAALQWIRFAGEGAGLPAFCAPQPCDWNGDGVMDMIWGDPFGQIVYALGLTKGGLDFQAPEVVRASKPAETIQFPAGVSTAPAASQIDLGRGGTADAQRFYRADGGELENTGGWPDRQFHMYGLVPSWQKSSRPGLDDDRYRTKLPHGSWAVAPFPGDITEVVEESNAPGKGKTLLMRWHQPQLNAIFTQPGPRLRQWTPGVSVAFVSKGLVKPKDKKESRAALKIRFEMKLTGTFTRMGVHLRTRWQENGELVGGDGGSITGKVDNPPRLGQWFTYEHIEPPGKFPRGVPGVLFINLLGSGEVRIRDVRLTEE